MVAISLFTLGGTIAMRDQGSGATPALGPDELVAGLGLEGAGIRLRAEAVTNLASGHLTLDHLYDLARRVRAALADGADGVVVTQGTDTLEETAWALDLLVPGDAPVVITGAMRTASSLASDGPLNLRDAIAVAADPSARGRGTLAVLNNTVHAARVVAKAHTVRVDAFVSRDGGPLGLVREGRIDWTAAPGRSASLPLPAAVRARVPLLGTWLGDDGTTLRALADSDIQGLVIEGLGGGHVPPPLIETLGTLAARIPVVLSTRCAAGPVLSHTYGYAGSERDLIARGLIPAGPLAGVKARLALALMLDGGAGTDKIKAFFASS